MLEVKDIVVGIHLYDPKRGADHPLLTNIATDPQNTPWTHIAAQTCYVPLAQSAPNLSYGFSPLLLRELEVMEQKSTASTSSAEQDFGHDLNQALEIWQELAANNGLGEPFIHALLPDLTQEDKQIIIEAGKKDFYRRTGVNPQVAWIPEAAIDLPSLAALKSSGYKGVVCAPEQIILENGQPADNTPAKVNLSNGDTIIVLPFDRPISNALAFAPKHNADEFARDHIKPRREQTNGHPLLAHTDGETFGEHWPNGNLFIKHLLEHSLNPEAGFRVASINEILPQKSDHLPIAKIREGSSWSCPHHDQNVGRWHGTCACSEGNGAWKQPYTQAMQTLNQSVADIVKPFLGEEYVQKIAHRLATKLDEKGTSPLDSLSAASVAALLAQTSCATFFKSPETSGRINPLFAFEAILHLQDAGLTKPVVQILNNLMRDLGQVPWDHHGTTAKTILEDMLNGK